MQNLSISATGQLSFYIARRGRIFLLVRTVSCYFSVWHKVPQSHTYGSCYHMKAFKVFWERREAPLKVAPIATTPNEVHATSLCSQWGESIA